VAHGPYLFKGSEEPIEVFEVGVAGVAPLEPPIDSEKVRRNVRPGDEITLGWRPAGGLELPGRANWIIKQRLGEGGFGEVWLTEHVKTGTRRVFKFCFQPDRLRGLKREVVLFRLLKEALGDRRDIARIIDFQFDNSPYFIESEYLPGGTLHDWAASRSLSVSGN
jgi:serine/threonine-protein kinase